MKKLGFKGIAAAAALFAAGGASALQLEPMLLDVSEGPIVRGQWNADYSAGREYADRYNVPLLVVYGGLSCGNCTQLQRACLTDEFLEWQNRIRPVMVYTYSSSDALTFAKPKTDPAIPYVGIYWNRNGEKPKKGSDFYKAFTGRDGQMLETGGSLASQLIRSLDVVVAGYVYDGGEFMAPGTNVNVRLEVEAGYEPGRKVIVPLNRESATSTGVNTLILNGVEYPVEWAVGDTRKNVEITMPADLGVGDTVDMELRDSKGNTHSEGTIYVVEPVANSVRNPYSFGEKTADELDWGEWTLDYETAKAKVAAAKANNEDAYILADFSGVFWCPYCNGVENSLLESDEFKAWAKANKVVLVLFDQGRASTPATAAATNLARLLSYEVGTTTIAGRPFASGAAYMTRKGVSPADAEKGIALVTKFTSKWLAPGSTAARIGNPTFLLIGDNDNVIARFSAWRDRNNVTGLGAMYYDPEENIARLDDLLLLAGGEGEGNGYVQTTTLSMTSGGDSVPCELQVNAATKVYAVGGVPVGSVTFTVGDKTVDRGVRLSVIRYVNGVSTTLATGFETVEYDFGKGETDGIYLQVSSFTTADMCGADSTFNFTISSEITLHPGVVSFASASSLFISGTGEGSVTLKRTNGVSGAASVKVALDAAASTAKEGEAFTWTDKVVTWKEGDDADKVLTFGLNTVSEGAHEAFVLRLADVTGAEKGSPDSTTIEIFDTDKPTLEQTEYDVTLYTGVNAASGLAGHLYNVAEGDAVGIKILSGRLPTGVKVVYDAATGNATFTGSARKAGTYPVVVAFEDKTTGSGLGYPVSFSITVANPTEVNPYFSKALTMTLPLFIDKFEGKSALVGVVELSLKRNNSISAKYSCLNNSRKVGFSGKWDAIEDGEATAKLTARSGEVLELALSADGEICAVVTDNRFDEQLDSGILRANDGKIGTDFIGAYTVALPEVAGGSDDPAGAGYLTINVTGANGKARWIGMMANGQRVSGTSTIVATTDGYGVVAAFVGKPKFSFAVPMMIKPRALESSSRRAVVCMEDTVATWEAYGVLHVCNAWGSVFNKESLTTLCAEGTMPTDLSLMFGTTDFTGSTAYGKLSQIANTKVEVSSSKFTLVDAPKGMKLMYRAKDGAITGSVKLLFAGKTVNGKFAGVIVPGWYDCHCDIPLAGDKFKIVDSLPLAIGAVYYSGERVNGLAAKRGFLVGVGIAETEDE